MRKVYIQLASREFLEVMAEDLARKIDAGETHNADGEPLAELLDRVCRQIPEAPRYSVEHWRR